MAFSENYKKLKPAIVAIVGTISRNPDFPDIIGTGFIVDDSGVVVTDDHVIQAIKKIPRKKDVPTDEWPIKVMLLNNTPEGMMEIFLEVEGVGTLGREKPITGIHYGSDIPDIGIIFIKAKGLPKLEIESTFSLNEGDELFVSGFPLGTDTLRAPGWIHQINPVLQKGTLGAIQPFPCDKPHGLLIDVMALGGSSGSPIFNPKTNKVTAILYGGIIDNKLIPLPNGIGLRYHNSTSLTLAIPAYIICEILQLAFHATDKKINEIFQRDTSKYLTLEQIIATYPRKVRAPKEADPDVVPILHSDLEMPK